MARSRARPDRISKAFNLEKRGDTWFFEMPDSVAPGRHLSHIVFAAAQICVVRASRWRRRIEQGLKVARQEVAPELISIVLDPKQEINR